MHANAISRDLFLQSFILDWAAVCLPRWRWIRTSIYFGLYNIINSIKSNTTLWLINGFNYCTTISINLANRSCQLWWYKVNNLSLSHVLVYVLLSMPDISISFIGGRFLSEHLILRLCILDFPIVKLFVCAAIKFMNL